LAPAVAVAGAGLGRVSPASAGCRVVDGVGVTATAAADAVLASGLTGLAAVELAGGDLAEELPAKNKLPAGAWGVRGCGCGRERVTGAGAASGLLFCICNGSGDTGVPAAGVTAFEAVVAAGVLVAGPGMPAEDRVGAELSEEALADSRAARDADKGAGADRRGFVGVVPVAWAAAEVAGDPGATEGSSVKPPELRLSEAVGAWEPESAAVSVAPAPKNITAASSELESGSTDC